MEKLTNITVWNRSRTYVKKDLFMDVIGWCTQKEFKQNAPDLNLGQGVCPALHCTELRKIEELWKFLTMKRVQGFNNKI